MLNFKLLAFNTRFVVTSPLFQLLSGKCFSKFWNSTTFSKCMMPSLYLQFCNYMSWTHISNIVKNTFLSMLILRMCIVDFYYYSNGIFTNMLSDVGVSCFLLVLVVLIIRFLLKVVLKVLLIDKPLESKWLPSYSCWFWDLPYSSLLPSYQMSESYNWRIFRTVSI